MLITFHFSILRYIYTLFAYRSLFSRHLRSISLLTLSAVLFLLNPPHTLSAYNNYNAFEIMRIGVLLVCLQKSKRFASSLLG